MKLVIALVLACLACVSRGQIPAKQRGYALRGSRASEVTVELCYDLLCDDSKASWALTKPLIDLALFNEEQFGLQLNVFPLPYHHHAFYVATAMRAYMAMAVTKTRAEIVNCIGAVFTKQERFLVSDAQMGEKELVDDLMKFFIDECAVNLEPIFANETLVREYNMQARYDWKYVASRGVHGTPSFIVNGFVSDTVGDFTSTSQWIEMIQNLLAGHDQEPAELKRRPHAHTLN